jgi:hypothetical protein
LACKRVGWIVRPDHECRHGIDLAAAHPGDEDQNDAKHAKQDLAGTSIV